MRRMQLPAPTPRLEFRAWRDDDLPQALALWGDPEVMRFMDAAGPCDAERAAARLRRELQNAETHGVQYWPLFLRDTGEFVGCCGLRPRSPGVYEMGFHMRPPLWGRGLATEAGRAVVEHARALGATGLFAGHHPHNDGSRRALTKLGFRYTHDEHFPPTGLMHPAYTLDL
jgi:RimJ/RimL family protein N-acetyltransferase